MTEEQEIRVQVEIFGEQYTLKGTTSSAQMLQVAQHVDKVMKKLAKRNPRLSRAQVQVLAALNMADELIALREEYENMIKMLEPE